MAKTLSVLLDDMPVGRLTLNAGDGCDFRLLESYKRAYPQPVLGQVFLDDPDQVRSVRAGVPPWFSNLLPEGLLRGLIAKQAGVDETREFFLLRHLGEDLPGAVRIVPDAADEESPDVGEEPAERAAGDVDDAWHFSLAGVQLKFSARRSERGLTIPVSGRGGDWIVKLPDARYRDVPRTEYATMRWAGAGGVAIPEIHLVPIADITGLPPSYNDYIESHALAIRRFDRPSFDARVHMEDFAQILDLYPHEKYNKYNYQTLAKLIRVLAAEGDLAQYVRRLVFMVASGNGDMHHKNWSLIYPDGLNPSLSPAYDLVSTIQFDPKDKLALNLRGSKEWEDVTEETFRRMARKAGVDESLMMSWVDQARTDILEAWRSGKSDFGYDAQGVEILERHMARVPLFSR